MVLGKNGCAMIRLGSVGLRGCVLVAAWGILAGSGRAEDEGSTGTAETPSVAATTAKVEAALEKRVTFNFVETGFCDVLEFIRDNTGVNVVVREGSLVEVGVDLDLPISLAVNDVSLRSALDLLLNPLGLVAVVRDEVLLITDRCSADRMLEVVVYPVGDLVVVKGAKQYAVHGDHLVDLIQGTLAPETWEEGGGSARIAFDPLTLSLVANQAQARQRELKALLERLRATKQALGTAASQGSLPALATLEVTIDRSLAHAAKREGTRGAKESVAGGGFGGGGPAMSAGAKDTKSTTPPSKPTPTASSPSAASISDTDSAP